MMERIAIIVAGGSGSRFGGQLPKQFMELEGKPVLMRTLEAFSPVVAQLVVVLPPAHLPLWRQLCGQHHFELPHCVVGGGDTRYRSVGNALASLPSLPDDAVIAVHDGVRPLVSRRLIEQAFAVAASGGSAVPAVPVTDSVRRVDAAGGSHALPRHTLRAVQTPQVFAAHRLLAAYAAPYRPEFTDDASVYEAAGYPVTLIDGDTTNIKITHRADLLLAQQILSNGRS